MFIVEIIKHTPIWVWGLLAFLLYRGFRSLKGGIVSLWRLAIIPALFSLGGFYDVATTGVLQAQGLTAWAIFLCIGLAAGWWRASGTTIRADKLNGLIDLPGSALALVLILTIFFVRYAAKVELALHHEVGGELWFIYLNAGVSGLVAGMFTGQLLGLWQKYRGATHVLLTSS